MCPPPPDPQAEPRVPPFLTQLQHPPGFFHCTNPGCSFRTKSAFENSHHMRANCMVRLHVCTEPGCDFRKLTRNCNTLKQHLAAKHNIVCQLAL